MKLHWYVTDTLVTLHSYFTKYKSTIGQLLVKSLLLHVYTSLIFCCQGGYFARKWNNITGKVDESFKMLCQVPWQIFFFFFF